MYRNLFIHSPTKGNLGCFQVWEIINKTTIDIWVEVFYMDLCFQIIWVNTKEHNCWIICLLEMYVYFCKKPLNCLPKWLYHFVFPPAMYKNSCCFKSLSAFGIVSVPDFGHSIGYIVVSRCSFKRSCNFYLFIYF